MSEPIESFSGQHRFLSNFHSSLIRMDNQMYTTLEHAYQAAKTLDPRERMDVALASTPGQAKRLGRQVTLRDDWEQIKVRVMAELLLGKFTIPALRTQLVETGDAPLVEGNTWHDQFWGDCTCPKHADVPGQNMLGKLLMELRVRLQYAAKLEG